MAEEGVRVLVIDDDPDVIEVITLGLKADGMQVLGVCDGAEGLEILSRERVDVVVLDVMMPTVDGWMVLTGIRSNPETATIPIIMLTAKDEVLAKVLAFKQGVQQYVVKPFHLQELSARIESLARGAAEQRSEHAPAGEPEFHKLAVRKGGRTVLLTIDEIVYLSARNKSTYAHTFENQYLVDITLGELEARLGRESFARVHRGFLVNLNRVKEILRLDGSYIVVVADRDETQIPVARRQVRTFREAVGI